MSHFAVAIFSHDPEEYKELLAPYDAQTEEPEYLEFVPADKKEDELRKEFEEHCSSDYKDFDSYLSRCYGYSRNEYGEIGYIANPNSKWDWYEVGGRQRGMLKLKSGCYDTRAGHQARTGYCDQALVKDVDFTELDVFAYITPEGEWFEAGTMAWCGMSDVTIKSRNRLNDEVKEVAVENPGLYITIVDCHI